MDDDRYDDGERGGLWDPDAVSPPSAPRRPALHVLPTPDRAEDDALNAGATTFAEDALVRLDEFRAVSDDEAPIDERARRRRGPRILVVAGVAVVSAMLAMGLARLTSDGGHPSSHRTATASGADTEQAALTRTVHPQVVATDDARRHRRPAARTPTKARKAVRTSHRRQRAQTVPTAPSRPVGVATTQTSAAVASPSRPAPTPVRSAAPSRSPAASATHAEFSFER